MNMFFQVFSFMLEWNDAKGKASAHKMFSYVSMFHNDLISLEVDGLEVEEANGFECIF